MQGPWFPPLTDVGKGSAVSSECRGFDPVRAVERMHQPERGSARSRWGAMQDGSPLHADVLGQPSWSWRGAHQGNRGLMFLCAVPSLFCCAARRLVQAHGRADQRPERVLVDRFALADVEGAPDVALG